MVIASPAGAYFSKGVKPIIALADRPSTPAPAAAAWARPRPAATTPSSLVAQQEATARGCDQVVFLDAAGGPVRRGARRHEHVLRLRRRHASSRPATGTHPRGHHPRLSIIELAGELGHQVEERRFSIDEWRDGRRRAATSSRSSPAAPPRWSPRSASCSGTAARPARPTSPAGELTMQIRQALVDIQYGRADDTFGWMHKVV